MTKLEEIEKAAAALSPEERAKLRTWLEEFDAQLLDDRIESDAKSGKLDWLAEEALADHKAGRSRKIPNSGD
jgi:hypothetical protein